MENIPGIPLKIEKESRREFNKKKEKDLLNNQFQNNNIRLNDNSKDSDNEKQKNKENILDEKNNINNGKMLKKNFFEEIFLTDKKEYEKNNKLNEKNEDDNLEKLMSYCNYDIFSYARHGHYKELEKLFLEGINPDSKDKFGNTLLIIAAQNNNKRILKICLRYGAQINMQNLMGNTALHFAKEYGYDDIFEYLIKKGANPNIKNLRGIEARNGLYNENEAQLFRGEGLVIEKNKKKFQNNKYQKYENNIIDKIK